MRLPYLCSAWSSASATVLFSLFVANSCSAPQASAPAAAAAAASVSSTVTPGIRYVSMSTMEYQGFFAGLDSLWISFPNKSDALSGADTVALDDLAEIMVVNPALHLRLWASAPEERAVAERPTGSDTELARRRRAVVGQYLLQRGVSTTQLRVQEYDPDRFPSGFNSRSTGGTLLFVASHAEVLNVPPRYAQVRVRARPGAAIFFIPRIIADRQPARAVCTPKRTTFQERVGNNGVFERPYPVRPILGVAVEPNGVVRTRRHEVDSRNRPDIVDLASAAVDPQCR